MKLNTLFRNPIRKEINELTNSILNEQWQEEVSRTKIESSGILDGREMIFEFIQRNEYGCAYEHLAYIISELNMELTSDQIIEMDRLAKKLNVKHEKK